MCLDDRACDDILDPAPSGAVGITNVDRKTAALTDNDGWIAEKTGDPLDIQCRRHDEKPQVVAKRRLHVECERQAEIRIERTFMEFVEDHAGDPGKFGILQNHPRENAFRHHFDPRSCRHSIVESHPVANPLAHRFADQRRHAAGSCACS